MLALAAAVLGLVVAYAGVGMLTSFAERFSARAGEIRLDGMVLGFTLVIAAATQAQRAGDLINPGEREATRDASGGPQIATVTRPHGVSHSRAGDPAPATDHPDGPVGHPERTSGWEAEAS